MAKLKTGLFERGFALAKMSVKSGALAAKQFVGTSREDYLIQQMKLLSEELGLLKGSLMKVGQTISMYGEHFLPEKANEYLKNLQSDSPKLPWEEIKSFLETEIGKDNLKNLEIEEDAIAAASLGQVHKAYCKKTNQILAIKIQYPGVEKAIKSDLKALKTIFNIAQVFPSSPRTDQFFEEIETMLIQETNYQLEHVWTKQMHEKLSSDSRYIVPKIVDQYCSRHVLTTTYEEGYKIDSKEVQGLPQEIRNGIALSFLDLYYKELFEFKLVQTDPHLGNYRIKINQEGKPQIILYDFGAMREVPDHFGKPFKNLVQAAAEKDRQGIYDAAYALKYLFPEDSEELKEKYFQMCCLIGEPFSEDPKTPFTDQNGNYDWKATDLPKRVAVIAKSIFKNHKLRVPPRESVFLDRKLGGSFIFCSVIGLKGKARDTLMKYF